MTKLKKRLTDLGISQTEAARRSGVDVYRLNKIANGAVRPGPETASKLAKALGCTVADITEEPRQ